MMTRTFYIFKGQKPEVEDTVYYSMMISNCLICQVDVSDNGVLISRYESDGGRMFDLRLSGRYEVTNHMDVSIKDMSWYAEYIKRGWKEMLTYSQIPVLKLIEISPETEDPIESVFHGVFYRVSDAEEYLNSIS